ncbi:uncharacterized protein [Ptychodera flava]
MVSLRLRRARCTAKRCWRKNRAPQIDLWMNNTTEWFILRSIASADFGLVDPKIESDKDAAAEARNLRRWTPYPIENLGHNGTSTSRNCQDVTETWCQSGATLVSSPDVGDLMLSKGTQTVDERRVPVGGNDGTQTTASPIKSGYCKIDHPRTNNECPDMKPKPSQSDSTRRVKKSCKNAMKQQREVSLVFLLFIVVAYILGGSAIFVWEESWSYLDSVYFSVITFTTIGFGDLIPIYGSGDSPRLNVIVLCSYILVGLVLMSACLNLSQNKISCVGRKLLSGKIATAIKKTATLKSKVDNRSDRETGETG